jgi:hypothetical protein
MSSYGDDLFAKEVVASGDVKANKVEATTEVKAATVEATDKVKGGEVEATKFCMGDVTTAVPSQDAIANATDAAGAISQLNLLLAACRAVGIVKAA